MAINTVLWAISYADIRRAHPRDEVETLLNAALVTAYYCSLKWPGVEGAIELYGTLQHTCLKAYDGDQDQSYSLASPINRPSPATTGSPEPVSSPLCTDFNHKPIAGSVPSSPGANSTPSVHGNFAPPISTFAQDNHRDPVDFRPVHTSAAFNFNPTAYDNPLPPINPGLGALAPENLYSPLFQTYTTIMGPGSEFAVNAWQTAQPMLALNMQQQSELMDKLERMDGVFG